MGPRTCAGGAVTCRLGVPLLGDLRCSTGPFFMGGEFLNVEVSLFEVTGDLALFADSRNQCLIDAN